ncbi:hypothetical protein ZIOFF_007337 [Zingiber officinale]|uniref:Potassium channel tetramerisation-type BTB domain-containing protein n=1 Tax=Zingiber officinale TaxID=94328 RepID=A0A8J5I3T8_ZINOF|nr:hypothetical protein ZIOFF_007337 [Zingiber officinale]
MEQSKRHQGRNAEYLVWSLSSVNFFIPIICYSFLTINMKHKQHEAMEFMKQGTLQVQVKEEAEYFINHNPPCFVGLLDLLRTGKLYIPPNIPDKLLFHEVLFYGLLDKVRIGRWGTFNENRLQLASSVSGCTHGDGTTIRADPNSQRCVSHDSMVHVYDWMLEAHPPIILDFQ